MESQQTNETELFINKCEEFAYAMTQLNIDAMKTEDDIEVLEDCKIFFYLSFPELLRLARIGLTLNAK